MPKFLVPILVLAAAFWIVFLIILNYTAPFANDPAVYRVSPAAYFLTSLLLALTFSAGLVFFFAGRVFSGPLYQKQLVRQSLRRGFLLGLWVVGFLLLKLTQTYHILNLILMTAVLVGVEVVFRSK